MKFSSLGRLTFNVVLFIFVRKSEYHRKLNGSKYHYFLAYKLQVSILSSHAFLSKDFVRNSVALLRIAFIEFLNEVASLIAAFFLSVHALLLLDSISENEGISDFFVSKIQPTSTLESPHL